MNNWEQDTLTAIQSIANEQELFIAIANAAKAIGFDYCAYGAKTPVPITKPKVVMFNNYNSTWQEEYARNNYIEIDPTVKHGYVSTSPIIWTPDKFSDASDMWENAHSHGLHHGWAQSSRDSNGLAGLLTLARSNDSITERELQSNQVKMTWLVQVAHNAMSRILTPKFMPETMITITPREKEVLCWTAEGKTAAEISTIMSISVGTVNFHINNFVMKLGSRNKIQAVVKAALCGMLS